MKVLVVAAAVLLSSVAALAQSQTDCQSYFVGTILYTSCHGQPARPAVGIDTSIYRSLQPVQIDPFGSMLKGAQLRLAEEQARLAREQAALGRETDAALAARRDATASTPQPAAVVNSPASQSDLSATELATLYLPETMNGHWWNQVKQRAERDDLTAVAVRVAAVKGVFDGLDLPLMVASPTFEDYKAKRAATWRSDLSLGQILTKIDGYYADPATLDVTLSLAVALAARMQKQ